MRRSLPTLVGVVATTLLLAACGSGSSSNEGTSSAPSASSSIVDLKGQTLTVLSQWVPASPQYAVQEAAIKELETETGLEVELSTAGDDLKKQYETAQVGGKAPDVVITNLVEEATGWLGAGATVDVGPYIQEWGLADSLRADAVDEWKDADGKVQGFPLLGFVWPVWFNMDLLTAAGVTEMPTTYDALKAAAEKLNAKGTAPFVVGGSDWSGNKLFFQIVQGNVGGDEFKQLLGKGAWCANPNAMNGIKNFVELRDAGLFIEDVEGYTADQMNSTFYEGKAAMVSAGSWAFPGKPATLNVELGGLPLPAEGAAYAKPTAMQGNTASGLFVSASAAESKLDAVKAFVTKILSPAVAGQMAEAGSYTTPVVSDPPIPFKDQLLSSAVNDLPSAVDFAVLPDNYIPGAASDALTRQTAAAYAKGVSAEDICQGLDSAY